MTGWLIFLGIVVLIAMFPLGGSVKYDESGLEAKLILGPFAIRLFPRPVKEHRPPKNKKPKHAFKPQEPKQIPEAKPVEQGQTTEAETEQPSKPAEKKPKGKDDLSTLPEEQGGSITDFLPLVQVALDMLGGLRRRLRVNHLQLRLTMAGDDPCDLAVNYGRANAAGAALMAQLERLFVIKKRDVGIGCDFTSNETKILARLELTITIGRVISLVTVYGIRALITFLKIQKQREEGGA